MVYFGLLGNTHIFVYCHIIAYLGIKCYILETMDMVIFLCNNGGSGKLNPIKYSGNYFSGLNAFVGVIRC